MISSLDPAEASTCNMNLAPLILFRYENQIHVSVTDMKSLELMRPRPILDVIIFIIFCKFVAVDKKLWP